MSLPSLPHPSSPQVLGELHERGMVIQVLDKAFDVVIAQYGAIQRVHTDVSTGPSDVCDTSDTSDWQVTRVTHTSCE